METPAPPPIDVEGLFSVKGLTALITGGGTGEQQPLPQQTPLPLPTNV
jgi:hypothetical protein